MQFSRLVSCASGEHLKDHQFFHEKRCPFLGKCSEKSFTCVKPKLRVVECSLSSIDTHVSRNKNPKPCSLLCLSNGHGEDSISVSILTQLQLEAASNGRQLTVSAFPLVGVGSAYQSNGIEIVGPTMNMPSGGFIYMNRRLLIGDIEDGLLHLLWQQVNCISEWVKQNPGGFVLAVGDVFPCTLAWIASLSLNPFTSSKNVSYAFVGTAKSEYYIRNEDGSFLSNNFQQYLESVLSPNSIFYPWERALMSNDRCKLVAVRDSLTTKCLVQSLPPHARNKVKEVGNPMMDNLEPSGKLDSLLDAFSPAFCVALLPGSRLPEAYENYNLILSCVDEYLKTSPKQRLLFLVPVSPRSDVAAMAQTATNHGWLRIQPESLGLESSNDLAFFSYLASPQDLDSSIPSCLMVVCSGHFADSIHAAEAGIAMAGTATEQLVGLGKPAFILPGNGPQFIAAFAEAQTRLLGPAVNFQPDPTAVAKAMTRVLRNRGIREGMASTGKKRMGPPGASLRIAREILKVM